MEPIATTYVSPCIQPFTPGDDSVYMLTVVPGLETAAANEAENKLHTTTRAIMRGKVFLSAADEVDYSLLRCADNVYAFLCAGSMGTTRDALRDFDKALVDASFMQAFQVWQSQSGNCYSLFTVSASVAGKRTYSRFEAAEAFAQAINAHTINDSSGLQYAPDTTDNHVIAFRLDMIDEFFMVSVKLTDAAFRFRGTGRLFNKAALRPTIAHALVWIAGMTEDDVFVDPFCGSGSIVCERATYPHKRLIANDIDAEAIDRTRFNLSRSGVSITHLAHFETQPGTQSGTDIALFTGDIADLSLEKASVHCIVTNPPWGGQIQTDDAFVLYKTFMRKADEWLKPDGRVVLLTPLGNILERAADAYAFDTCVLFTVSLHGTICCVYRLTRKVCAQTHSNTHIKN